MRSLPFIGYQWQNLLNLRFRFSASSDNRRRVFSPTEKSDCTISAIMSSLSFAIDNCGRKNAASQRIAPHIQGTWRHTCHRQAPPGYLPFLFRNAPRRTWCVQKEILLCKLFFYQIMMLAAFLGAIGFRIDKRWSWHNFYGQPSFPEPDGPPPVPEPMDFYFHRARLRGMDDLPDQKQIPLIWFTDRSPVIFQFSLRISTGYTWRCLQVHYRMASSGWYQTALNSWHCPSIFSGEEFGNAVRICFARIPVPVLPRS